MINILESSSFFSILLTFGAYQIGLLCQKRLKGVLWNPILIAMILIIVFLKLVGIPNVSYQSGCSSFSWLLTPATVCLAIPLYRQFDILKKNFIAILLGILAGVITCLFMTIWMSRIFQFEHILEVSLLPKSITTSIGIALSEVGGGVSAITSVAIIVTGILGSLCGVSICRAFGIDNPIAQGVAFGTASHLIGTTRATEQSELTGAVSSLSLVIAGVITSFMYPLVLSLV